MAKKRMFNLTVLETDAFLDMPLSTQALYFHLCLRGDDDGFIANPKRIVKTIGASLDDLRMLVMKRFVIAFEDGVIVIKHWRMHNAIKSDRYSPTVYQEDFELLKIKPNNAYTLGSDDSSQEEFAIDSGSVCAPFALHSGSICAPDGFQMGSVDKIRLDKDSIDKNIEHPYGCLSDRPDENSRKAGPYDAIISAWNALEAIGITPIRSIGSQRKTMLDARIKQYGIDSVLEAISLIRKSNFLQGKHKGRPWQITFDWFVRPNNFPKVLEGNYTDIIDDKPVVSGIKAETPISDEDWLRMMQESD